MIGIRSRFAWLSVVCLGAFGQTPAVRPEFDPAVVTLNSSADAKTTLGMLPSGLFTAVNIQMSDLVRYAYRIRGGKIPGAPGWFDEDRFDIKARGPANASQETVRLLLQTLIEKEFKLKFHQEDHDTAVFALTAGRTAPALKLSEGTGEPECKRVRAQSATGPRARLVCSNMTMSELAARLPDLAPGYVDRPVVDQTGLTGAYDFGLEWTGAQKTEAEGGITLFGAMEKLGLKLTGKKVALPQMVIDSASRL